MRTQEMGSYHIMNRNTDIVKLTMMEMILNIGIYLEVCLNEIFDYLINN